MKLHILAIAAHPDDIELSCGGTLIKHVSAGHTAGIADLTEGELGSRGTVETRYAEAKAAAAAMGIAVRENLRLPDGFFDVNKDTVLRLVQIIRKYQPDILLANALHDRHPDHVRAARLAKEAWFISGLRMVKTICEGKEQMPWRPKRLFHYIQNRDVRPDFMVDISGSFEKKMEAVKSYRTQFMNEPRAGEPTTYISTPEFLKVVEARDRYFGHCIGTTFAEGFCTESGLGIDNLDKLLYPDLP